MGEIILRDGLFKESALFILLPEIKHENNEIRKHLRIKIVWFRLGGQFHFLYLEQPCIWQYKLFILTLNFSIFKN